MKKDTNEYTLDFVIPRGNIGDVGIQGVTGIRGPIGPTGPVNSLEAMAIFKFRDTENSGNLYINQISILPSTSNIANYTTNSITLNNSGCYEFTISGCLAEEIKGNRARIRLQSKNTNDTNVENIITVYLSDRYKTINFSYTQIKKYDIPKKLVVDFYKASSNANVQDMILMIKKLPF